MRKIVLMFLVVILMGCGGSRDTTEEVKVKKTYKYEIQVGCDYHIITDEYSTNDMYIFFTDNYGRKHIVPLYNLTWIRDRKY